MVGLYPSIPHNAGLEALKTVLDKRENHSIPTEKLVKMAEFVLKNIFFEFNGLGKEQISGKTIGTKYAQSYACIFMDEFETKFIESQRNKPLA